MEKALLIGTAMLTLSASAFAFECLGPTDIQKAIDTYHQNEIRFVRDFKGKQIAFTWNFKRANTFGDHVSVDFGGGDSEVTCRHIDQKTQDLMVEWNRGQWASVEGTIDDAGYETLYLKNCVISIAEKK
jgi:hypothetical protein